MASLILSLSTAPKSWIPIKHTQALRVLRVSLRHFDRESEFMTDSWKKAREAIKRRTRETDKNQRPNNEHQIKTSQAGDSSKNQASLERDSGHTKATDYPHRPTTVGLPPHLVRSLPNLALVTRHLSRNSDWDSSQSYGITMRSDRRTEQNLRSTV
jgi:hypothetical protein